MKKLLFFAFALAFGSSLKAQTYSPIAVTGYNADVVADGTGAVAASTTHDVDGVNYNFMAQGYTNPTPITTTRGLPTSGLITTVVAATPGLTYQLAPYTANNSLRINGVGTGTLTFTTPTAGDKVYVLATSGSGTSIATITVTFTDNTTQTFTQTVNDWYDNTGFAIQGIGRVNRTDNGIDNNTINPRLYQYELLLTPGNFSKPIQSISFANTGNVLNVMGISLRSLLPNDAAITAITAPVSPVMQNTNQPVIVTLANQGINALTSATITWTLDGVAQTPFAFTGNVPFNQSTTVTIGTVNLAPGSRIINACVTDPNNTINADPSNCFQVTLNACALLSGTYTIDKPSPVSATNFQSIGAAVTAMSSCGISGPVIFNVVAGSGPYPEQVIIPAIAGASATNTITFNGNGNTVSADVVSATRPIFRLNGADFVTINNFTISTTGTTTSSYGWGIHLQGGADNNTISNNIINIGSVSTTESNSTGIVFSNSTTSVTSTGNNGNNNVISGNTINGGFNGIVLYNLNTSLGNNQITGNIIKDFYANGIKLGSVSSTLVENNNISRPTRTIVSISSTSSFVGIELNGTTNKTTISKNRIHTSHGAATSLAGTAYGINSTSNDAPVGSENIVKNNVIYNFGNTGAAYGFFNTGSDGIYYYHNTVNLDNTANTGAVRGFYQTTTASNIRFLNNNISVVGGATGVKHAIFLNTTASTIRSNFNNLYLTGGATGSGIGSWSTANQLTLADWRTASSKDSTSVSADPLFTNITTSNFLPTAPDLNNVGRPVNPAVTDDITGALRNPATPDPGAYEMGTFTPATSDAGVSAITAPNSGCSLTNAEVVTITINNFGATTLTSIPVSYTINGGTPVNETFTGSIAPGATATYSFATTANLAAPNSYSIVASTNLAGDGLASNNSFTKVVVASAPAIVPIITAGGPTTFCPGGSVILTAASTTTGATYTWFNNGTAITGATAATYTANAAGSYSAVATANGCPSAASAATTVTLNAAPATPTTNTGGTATTFCAGGSVTISVTTPVTGTTYQWFNNGTAITGATNSSLTANTSGSYSVTATTGGCPSAASAATVVTVNAAPVTPTITAGGPVIFCTGGSVVLTAASTTTGATYTWFLNGTIIPNASAATFTANAAGSYTAVATANNCSSAASAATAVTVNATPATPTVTKNGFALTSSSATGNQWYLNATPITGATNATYTTTANGTYTVIVSTNGCPSSASSAVTITNTGIKNDQDINVSVFPNPSTGLFNLTLPQGNTYEMQVMDLTGKVIMIQKTSDAKAQLDLQNAAKGIYLLKLVSEGKTATRKLIVE